MIASAFLFKSAVLVTLAVELEGQLFVAIGEGTLVMQSMFDGFTFSSTSFKTHLSLISLWIKK